MRRILLLTLSLIGCMGNVFAQIPTDILVRASAIVEGLFYDGAVSTKTLIPGGSTMAILKDPEGKMVIGVYFPDGYEMEESVKNKAIPKDRVIYADRLLRDYDIRRPQTVAVYEGLGVNEGDSFIEFEYYDIDNNAWNNAMLRGKVYVINIWQSECGPCRREMPVLSEWKNRFPDVVFLSASRHNREEILPIAERHNFTWTHLTEATDIVALVRQQGFPMTVVVDKNGTVRFAKVGADESNQAEALAVIEELSR